MRGKFVQQGQLVIKKDFSSLYCRNSKDFSTARLLLDTNSLTLDPSEQIDVIKMCLRDITALRSSINIIQVVEQINEATLELDEVNDNGEYLAQSIQYKGKTKFKLIAVDFQVIEQYISKETTAQFNKTWEFFIDPVRLDIIQNRTGNIVNVQDDVSVYFTTQDNQVIIDLTSKQAKHINSISLPIADTYKGSLPKDMPEVAIHDSTFRLLNILRVTEKDNIDCFFDENYNIFFISSKIEQDRNVD